MAGLTHTQIVAYLKYPGDPVISGRTLLAVALLTLGVPPHGDEFFVQTMDTDGAKPVFANLWTFEPQSTDGQHKTHELIARWDDATWLLKNGEHPLAVLRRGLDDPSFAPPPDANPESPSAYLATGRENLIRVRKALAEVVPLIKITQGKRSVFIPANATEDERAKLMAIFSRP